MNTDRHNHIWKILKCGRSFDHTNSSEGQTQSILDRASCKTLFDNLDHDSDGFIDINDYPIAYQSRQDLRERVAQMDINGDGKISFEEFYISVCRTIHDTQSFFSEDGRIKWRCVFEHYDLDKSGFLEISELNIAFVDSGQMTAKELQQLVEEIDIIEKDNRISFLEFLLYHIRQA